MNCQQLAKNIEQLRPDSTPQEVARLCLLLTNTELNLDDFQDRQTLEEGWKRAKLQLQLATDQHAAMTEELENLAASDPKSFTQDQIWTLIRAIKVQSQILEMYVGYPLLEV